MRTFNARMTKLVYQIGNCVELASPSKCPICHNWVEVTKAGYLVEHDHEFARRDGRTGRCPGSGKKVR